VIERRPLLVANLVILLVAIAVGYVVHRGAFGYADALNLYSPYPQLDAANGTPKIASTPWRYVRDWYTGLNGRWGQAVMNAAIAAVSRAVRPTPEGFPWWLLRSVSLFCIFAIPLNLLAAAGVVSGAAMVALLAIWMTWSVAPNTMAYSFWFEVLLTDRFLPAYFVSLMLAAVGNGWPANGRQVAVFGIAYVFLSVEQFLVSLPVLVLGVALARWEPQRIRSAARWLPILCLGLSAVAGAIYLVSPGQRWRNSLLNTRPLSLAPAAIVDWMQQAFPIGYRALLVGGASGRLWAAHLALYLALTVAVIVLVRSRFKNDAATGRPRTTFAPGVLAWTFLTAYATSVSTLLVSPHFPVYAAQYPTLLLAAGLAFAGRFAFELARLPRPTIAMAARLMAIATLLAVTVRITIPALRRDAAEYREERWFGELRKRTYHQVLDRSEAGQGNAFILTNSPIRSIGGTMEPPWGLAAYFRWRDRRDLVVVIDTNYDYATRPDGRAYVTIDLGAIAAPHAK
jgi:hypothetical protein